jgi:hypothetical protein
MTLPLKESCSGMICLARMLASVKPRLDEIAKQERRSLSKRAERLVLEECFEFRDREQISPPAKDGRRRKH